MVLIKPKRIPTNPKHKIASQTLRKTSLITALCLVIGSTLLGLTSAEIFIRYYGKYTAEGDFIVNGIKCYPYRLSLETLGSRLDYQIFKSKGHFRYDHLLGWTARENFSGPLYSYNSFGIRTQSSDDDIPKEIPLDKLRIALFGDSFTHAEGVVFKDTWGQLLENELRRSGINAEVLNFGFSAYGTDQAYLRWSRDGKQLHPHIVILGLQLENINRNGNLIRPLYVPERLPRSKPRFISENGALKLINTPVPHPKDVPDIVGNFKSWEYAPFEEWYDPADYIQHFWLKSRLVGFIYSWYQKEFGRVRSREDRLIDLTSDIILKFKNEAESSGSNFYVLFIPVRQEFVPMLSGRTTHQQSLLRSLKVAGVQIIDPSPALLDELRKSGLISLIPYHYSPRANQILAQSVHDHIIQGR